LVLCTPAGHNSSSRAAHSRPRVLIVLADQRLRPFAMELMRRRELHVSCALSCDSVERYDLLSDAEVVVVCVGRSDGREEKLCKLLLELRNRNLPGIVVGDHDAPERLGLPAAPALFERLQWIGPEVTVDELWGRICTLLDYSPILDRMEGHLGRLERWVGQMTRRFDELHEELHLAWRVQRDFLPRELPQVGRLKFAVLFRPASWVSGDIYDVFQLDEQHVGFYAADVVGHGVSAGLMTLFVKRALVTKHVMADGYRLVPPEEALAILNRDLADQDLPNSQFVTACYVLANAYDMRLSIARGGHPPPVLLDVDGRWRRLEATGPLMGVFEDAEFEACQVRMAPGQKLLLFTDGLEAAFWAANENAEDLWLTEHAARLANLPAEQFVEAMSARLDMQASSLHPQDDITLLVAEAVQ